MTYITDIAKGDNGNIQINLLGKLGVDDNLKWNNGLIIGDNLFIDNSSIVNTVGDLNITNNHSNSNIIFKLGDNSGLSNISFTDNLDNQIVKINSNKNENSESTTSGTVQIIGGLGVSLDISANSINTISDYNMKKNIKRLKNPLDTLNKINGYKYEMKYTHTNKENWGVIAQQLEDIGLSHMVNDGPDHKSVNYLMLIPLLIEAVKELSCELEKVKSNILK
jgi:hypothetical protein